MICIHDQIDVSSEWHDDMHCEGWRCRACGAYVHGECHHQSTCRDDFCGAGAASREPEPLVGNGQR